jgi:hypothetical protein
LSADLPRVERAEDGHALWFHECVDVSFNDIGAALPTGGERGWQWTKDGGLTPSILCHRCKTHGWFWVGGEHPYWRKV